MAKIPTIVYGWGQSTPGGNLRGYEYDLENELLYVTYATGEFNVFYNVPQSTARALYYSKNAYKYYLETIEQIYGTLLLTDNFVPLITNDGKYVAAT